MGDIMCKRDAYDDCMFKGVCRVFGEPDGKCVAEYMDEPVRCMYCKKEIKRKETYGDKSNDNSICCKECH